MNTSRCRLLLLGMVVPVLMSALSMKFIPSSTASADGLDGLLVLHLSPVPAAYGPGLEAHFGHLYT